MPPDLHQWVLAEAKRRAVKKSVNDTPLRLFFRRLSEN